MEQAGEDDDEVDDFSNMADSLLNKMNQDLENMQGARGDKHGGAKRYILTPPQSCDQVELIPDPDHPSYRHSQVDWSNITDAKKHNFDKVDAIDTIVRAGEVLYVPSYWMHYIISLSMSIQCNSRFGPNESLEAYEPIKQCFERDMKKNPWNESSKESHGGKHKHHKKGFSLGF